MTVDNIVTLGPGYRGWHAASRDDCPEVSESRPEGDQPPHASPTDAKRSHQGRRWTSFSEFSWWHHEHQVPLSLVGVTFPKVVFAASCQLFTTKSAIDFARLS